MILEANHNKTWYKGTKVADQVVTLDTRFLVALNEHRREKTLALTCFQQCGILTSAYSDKPVQPTFKLINSKCCSVSSLTIK